jgi:DinB superfamily
MHTLERFSAIVTSAAHALRNLSPADASPRPKPGAWSKKEELGHLIDSAINNYARIIRAQNEDAPALPGYQQDVWVERQGYQDRDWSELISLWSAFNQHMLAAARRIPAEALTHTCTIAGSKPLTLEFVIEDYVDHMVHHLQHIGLDLSQFRRAQSA